MAIEHVGINDTQAITKVNAAIDKANLVDGKAAQSALDAEVSARAGAVAAEASARSTAVSGEATARAGAVAAEASTRGAADTALSNRITAETTARGSAIAAEATARGIGDGVEASARQTADDNRPTFSEAHGASRPGEARRYFTSSIDGAPSTLSPLADTAVSVSNDGMVGKLVAGVIASVAAYRIEPGRQYRVRYVVRRQVDTDDPSNDAIRLAVRWLNKDKAGLATEELANLLDVLVTDGRLEYEFVLSVTDDAEIDAVPPYGAVYFRPFVQTFGGGITFVEVIEVTDLTLGVDWSPDVSEYRREVAGLTAQLQFALDRISALEA